MSKYYTPTKEEIRALRVLMGYTQVEMADMLMSSVNAYSRWEQGATRMSPAIWQAVQIIVAQAKEQKKPTKLTVYEQRQQEKQAEAERRAMQEAKYEQRRYEREQEEIEQYNELLPRFNQLYDLLEKRFGHALKEFDDYTTSHQLASAIFKMEKLYAQHKDVVDAVNAGTYQAPTFDL